VESGYTLRTDSWYIENEATATMNGVGQSSLIGNNLFQVNQLSNYQFPVLTVPLRFWCSVAAGALQMQCESKYASKLSVSQLLR